MRIRLRPKTFRARRPARGEAVITGRSPAASQLEPPFELPAQWLPPIGLPSEPIGLPSEPIGLPSEPIGLPSGADSRPSASGDGGALMATAPIAASPISRRVILVAVIVALFAAAGSSVALRYRTAPHVTTRILPGLSVGVDASGCPVGARCDYGPAPTPELLRAVASVFPDARQVSGGTTWVSAYEAPSRSLVIVATNDGSLISVVTQCTPAGSAVTPWRADDGLDALIVVPGAGGCSAAVSAHASPGTSLRLAALERLAHDPSIQLHA